MHRVSAESRFVNNRARELVIKAYSYVNSDILARWVCIFQLENREYGHDTGVPGGKH